MDAGERSEALATHAREAAGCERCGLAATCTQVVYGAGPVDAPLMLVGEAPGFHEDRDGVPFAGRAGELVERLLAGIGIGLDEVYLATVLKCRVAGNREPLPEEWGACEPYLYRQLELVRPKVVATLGSFATTLLSGKALGITRAHGQEQEVTLGGRRVVLYPLFHPAAALYTPAMLEVLERDVARLPDLLERDPPALVREPVTVVSERFEVHGGRRPVQLGLF